MIKFENRYDEYAYRVATLELDPSVSSVEEGQWVTISDGKIVISDGTKKSFMVIGSKRVGRDQVSGVPVKQVAFLHGPFIVATDKFDAAQTYNDMTPLKVTTGGILTPWVSGTDSPDKIVAYAMGAPVGGFLRIISA